MNIGIYISPEHTAPPNERQSFVPWVLASDLAGGLVDHQHKVFLFAAHGSQTRATLVDYGIRATMLRRVEMNFAAYKEAVLVDERRLFAKMIEVAVSEKLDVIHIHNPVERLYEDLVAAPASLQFVITIHEPLLSTRAEGLAKVAALPNCHLVTISNAQRDGFKLPFAGTVYNGLSLGAFPLGTAPATLVMTAGRLAPEKGFVDAVKAAAGAGRKLVLAAKEYEGAAIGNEYWRNVLLPVIDGRDVEVKHFLSHDALSAMYQSASAFLYPILWDEPFGLVMMEALASGTPVIAYDRGSVPEIVVDGVTGFIIKPEEFTGENNRVIQAKGVAGMIEAIGRVSQIDRAACRKHIEEHFSLQSMVVGYERIYETVKKS